MVLAGVPGRRVPMPAAALPGLAHDEPLVVTAAALVNPAGRAAAGRGHDTDDTPASPVFRAARPGTSIALPQTPFRSAATNPWELKRRLPRVWSSPRSRCRSRRRRRRARRPGKSKMPIRLLMPGCGPSADQGLPIAHASAGALTAVLAVGGARCWHAPVSVPAGGGALAPTRAAGLTQESMKKPPSLRPVQLLIVDVPSPVTWLPAAGEYFNPVKHSAVKFHT